MLVIDMGSQHIITSFAVFQMFSDGKISHIQLFAHSSADAAPGHNDGGWNAVCGWTDVPAGQLNHQDVPVTVSVDIKPTSTRYLKV